MKTRSIALVLLLASALAPARAQQAGDAGAGVAIRESHRSDREILAQRHERP